MNAKERNKLEYIAITLLTISSGSVCFYRLNAMLSLMTLIFYSLYFHKKFLYCQNKSSLPFIIVYCIYICLNFLFLNTFNNVNRIIPYLVFAICSYMILSKMNFISIIDKLTRIVGLMSIISIAVYFLYTFSIVNVNNIEAMGVTYSICLFHNMGWGESFGRLAGIYWEPGAYQIILNTCLFLRICSSERFNDFFQSGHKLDILWIIAAILLTESTTGYMTLLFNFSYGIYKYIFVNRKGFFTLIFSFVVIIGFTLFIYNSDALQVKIAQSDSNNRSSYTVRYADNVALIQMIKEKPYFGWSIATKDYNKRALQLDNETSSNGILFFIAIFGIPFFIYLIYICYKHSRFIDSPPVISVLFFIIMNIGECFLYYPLVFFFLIDFNDKIKIYKYENSSNYADKAQK